MRFRTRIVLVLAVIGLLPLLVLGWLSFSLNRDELERTVGGAHQRFSARCSVRIALVNVRLVVERERLLEQLRKFESELEKRDAQLHEKRTEIEIMSRFCATGRAERRPGAIERSGPCRAAV